MFKNSSVIAYHVSFHKIGHSNIAVSGQIIQRQKVARKQYKENLFALFSVVYCINQSQP